MTRENNPGRLGGLVRKLALTLEKSRFVSFIELSQPTGRLVRQGLVAGMARGFGIVIGATLVAGIVLALFAMVGGWIR